MKNSDFVSHDWPNIDSNHVAVRTPDVDHLAFERKRPPMTPYPTDGGFLVDNGAKLKYYASFRFKYDNDAIKDIELNVGDKVFVTFNGSSGARTPNASPAIKNITGEVKEIIPVEDGFILVVDSSEQYNGAVYKIGSRTILDAGLLNENWDKKEDNTPSASKVEIEIPKPNSKPDSNPAFPPKKPDKQPHEYHHKPDEEVHHRPTVRPPVSICWTNDKIGSIFDTTRKYNLLNFIYSKKAPVDTLMVIYDLNHKIVFKALDNSKKVSMKANFVWTLRDYISYISENVDLMYKLKSYTVDYAGKFVMTPAALLDEKVREVDKSNECFPESVHFIVEIVTGPDLLDYNPFGDTHKYEVISKKFITSADIIKNALMPEVDNGEDDGNISSDPVGEPDDGNREDSTGSDETDSSDNTTGSSQSSTNENGGSDVNEGGSSQGESGGSGEDGENNGNSGNSSETPGSGSGDGNVPEEETDTNPNGEEDEVIKPSQGNGIEEAEV